MMFSSPPSVSTTSAPTTSLTATPPTNGLLLAVDPDDVLRYPATQRNLVAAHTTADAVRDIEQRRPYVVTIDWDYEPIDGAAVCRTACRFQSTTVMMTTDTLARVPTALRLGCHAVLLKPFARNLAAARLGRLLRDAAMVIPASARAMIGRGSNRTWARIPCPQCATPGAVSFDHASHRQSWYACLACCHVWRGARQE